MALDQGKAIAGYDAVLAVPALQAAFGYGPGSAEAKAQAVKFTSAVNSGSLGNLKSIHALKGAAGVWDQFVDAFAKGYGDAGVKFLLNSLKPALL